MAIITFPSSPSVNQTYTVGSKTWIYNGYAWDLQLSSSGFSKKQESGSINIYPRKMEDNNYLKLGRVKDKLGKLEMNSNILINKNKKAWFCLTQDSL